MNRKFDVPIGKTFVFHGALYKVKGNFRTCGECDLHDYCQFVHSLCRNTNKDEPSCSDCDRSDHKSVYFIQVGESVERKQLWNSISLKDLHKRVKEIFRRKPKTPFEVKLLPKSKLVFEV